MTDVRLTATNPDDSSVVPVACNSRGELLITDLVIEQIDNDVDINGVLEVNRLHVETDDGSPVMDVGGTTFLQCKEPDSAQAGFKVNFDGQTRVVRYVDAAIAGYSFVGTTDKAFEARNASNNGTWSVSYSGQTRATKLLLYTQSDDPSNWQTVSKKGGGTSQYVGPVLDVGEELEFLRAQVRALMERLKMAPEGGWPVWDGSD